jgi:predicted phosphodiesterase
MKYAVISDIHANLEALTSVLREIDRLDVDRIVCLGDIVGYHANPNECIELLRSCAATCIAGNHDRAAVGQKDVLRFGARARQVIHWTRRVLRDENREFLAKLPMSLRIVTGADTACAFEAFFCVHGGLYPEPNDDVHLVTGARIEKSLELLAQGRFGARLCFFGHTHHAVVHERCESSWQSLAAKRQILGGRDSCYLVNPGSVGEPRESDVRACFLSLDSKTGEIDFHRVRYDASACRAKVERAGLWSGPTIATRSTDWVFDKIDMGRSAARRLMRALPSAK